MGRKNQTARLKINTNNGRGNAPRVQYIPYYYIYLRVVFSTPSRHKFRKIRRRTTHDPRARFIYYRPGMQYRTYYCCCCAYVQPTYTAYIIICVRYNNMRIKVPRRR